MWNDLKIEASKSPNITLFQKFRDSYKAIPYSDTSLYKIFNQTRTPQILKDMIADVTSVLQNIKKADVYRDDYQELINLTLTYLGVNEEYTFLKPGAVHRARWLAKTLYCLKITMLKDHVPKGVVNKTQIQKIERFTKFVAVIYCPWWFQCMLGTSAPRSDLEFVKQLDKYRSIDRSIAESAIKAFQRHTWYLTAEMCPLALWDDSVSSDENKEYC